MFLGAFAVPSLVYLVRPAIVPDQLWAIRRFEPITLPGLAIAAGVGAWWLAGWVGRRFQETYEREHATHVASVVAAIVLIAAPITTYVSVRPGHADPVAVPPYLYTKEQGGARAEIDNLCRVIDGRPTILSGSSGYFGTIRVMCDVPVVLALEPLQQDALARMEKVWGQEPVVVTRNPDTVWSTAPAPVFANKMVRGEYALERIPRLAAESTSTWYAGTVGSDGSVTPIAPLE